MASFYLCPAFLVCKSNQSVKPIPVPFTCLRVKLFPRLEQKAKEGRLVLLFSGLFVIFLRHLSRLSASIVHLNWSARHHISGFVSYFTFPSSYFTFPLPLPLQLEDDSALFLQEMDRPVQFMVWLLGNLFSG